MKRFVLKKYEELKNSKEDNSKEILAVLQQDKVRANKAFKEIYKLFTEEIEIGYIDNIMTLAVAYIIEEEI